MLAAYPLDALQPVVEAPVQPRAGDYKYQYLYSQLYPEFRFHNLPVYAAGRKNTDTAGPGNRKEINVPACLGKYLHRRHKTATATDIEELIAHVQQTVIEAHGIELLHEVRIVGEAGP